MPISSGATGRVVVGVETSEAGGPDGLKKETKLSSRSNDSYLQRYLDSTQRLKQGRDSTGDTSPPHVGLNDGENIIFTDGAKTTQLYYGTKWRL
ncbi:hypothetical protein NHX12_029327 [Muraenolepis orangiensis]|uniref:Uncharacterized protein n=1 Tax=Muraenolepis orangiensis TaxID=630683 RepID=A0A9Q0IL30_9TELE|nr:hypothetical protein NHX12_029327 [Muraenolepis orangiensis]